MKTRIQEWFASPVFPRDELRTQRASILHSLILISLLYSGLSACLQLPGNIRSSVFIVDTIVFLVFAMSFLGLRSGRIELVANGLIGLGFLWGTVAGISQGGISTSSVAAYLFAGIVMSVFYGARGVLFACVLAVAGLLLAQYAGLLQKPEDATIFKSLVTDLYLVGLAGCMGYYFNHASRAALSLSAKQQLQENSEMQIVSGNSASIAEPDPGHSLIQVRLELLECAVDMSLNEFMQTALDKIAFCTDSVIGFYHFVDSDQKSVQLKAWSTRTLQEFCRADGKNAHSNIDTAGVWGDCIRQNRPVIHNDYASLADRKGLPAGHARVIRELVVPVHRGGKVVSILGVGNKPTDYDEKDVEAVSYLADVVWEIVKRKQSENTLSRIESLLGVLIENLDGTGLFVHYHDPIDNRPIFDYINTGMEKLTGVKKEDAVQDGMSLLSTILPEYHPQLAQMEDKARNDLLSFETEVRQKHAISGDIRWILLRFSPRKEKDGSIVFYCIQMDITERKRNEQFLQDTYQKLHDHTHEIEMLHDELRQQSLHDPLTGLYNRRYLDEKLEEEIARCDRENTQMSIVLMDIDHFKLINDTYGHKVGDQFLAAVSRLMKNNIRPFDIACRYGGEEFLLVLVGTTMQEAARRAEDLRQKATWLVIPHAVGDLTISISFGVANYPIHGKDADDLINKADQALYYSKHSGRNLVTIWNPTQLIPENRDS